MENLKLQDQIINLGKLFVKELGLEDEVDTLSRWMAHYVAEKITLLETLPAGENNENARKECFETILKLWQNRWHLPPEKRLLKNFQPILDVLQKIDPAKESSFFYSPSRRHLPAENDSALEEVNQYTKKVEEIDKVARTWINFLLEKAALAAKDENTEEILDNALPAPYNYDIDTIQVLFGDDIEDATNKYMQETLKKRISELEKFSKINEFILEEYRKELFDVEDDM